MNSLICFFICLLLALVASSFGFNFGVRLELALMSVGKQLMDSRVKLDDEVKNFRGELLKFLKSVGTK